MHRHPTGARPRRRCPRPTPIRPFPRRHPPRRPPWVIRGSTRARASPSRRQTSRALYPELPPVTPRTMRLPVSMEVVQAFGSGDGVVARLVGSGLVGGVRELDTHDLVGGDLFEADAQRLTRDRADLGRDHVAEPVAELVEVRVYLTCPPGRQGGQTEI